MARSLEIQREENVGTSKMLLGFLAGAALLLLLGAVFGGWSGSDDAIAAPQANPAPVAAER